MASPAAGVKGFLAKTYAVVDDPSTDETISWNDSGTAFVVWRPAEFARDLLPAHFKHTHFSSFVLRLLTYGFRKVVPDRWEFANDGFRKGEKHLLRGIRRRKGTGAPAAIPISSPPATASSGGERAVSSPPPPPRRGAFGCATDLDVEAVVLSPSTKPLVCEVCGEGFRREQNLELHRRREHNLPSKRKLRDAGSSAAAPPPPKQEEQERVESTDEAPICASGGAIFRLPAKLDGLLRHGSVLPKGAEEEIPLIKHDIQEIIAILHGHISRWEAPPVMVSCWMKEVRELSYDIEDCIDQYEHATDSNSKYVCKIPCCKFTSRRTIVLHEKLKQRLQMANKIREFSVRVQEALQRHGMCNIAGVIRTSTDALVHSPHHTNYRDPTNTVGIDVPMNKLEEWLIKDGEQRLRVVAILGSGGVGKTTLASELYCKLGGKFECKAFVRASQNPDMRSLLSSMFLQVWPHQPPDHIWKVYNLIAEIRKYLQDKRFLIVVDGVWTTTTWDIVSCVLPDGNCYSRVLVTTEIEDVAHKCCNYECKYIFTMKPLGYDDSRKLFVSTVFGSEHECPSELNEVSDNITRKCGGFPLAIVSMASLLASFMGKQEQWDCLHRSLGYGFMNNATILDGMKQVLKLSYTNLPPHLKACMLYIGIFEENYIIWKDDLVKQWIAEGFICAAQEQDKEEIAGSYFDELVSRRMIQPVYINDNSEVLSCVVHHMVLDIIAYESMQENFSISIDHSQTTTRLADKVRRLSLHFGNAEDAKPPENMRLSQVRTLAFFGVFKCLLSIAEFQFLQVLIIHFLGDEENISFDLSRISGLFRLRYLQVTCDATLELQSKMRGLQCLEALKIEARASVIPSDITHLRGLQHLSLPVLTNLPSGIGYMTSLRTLECFDLSGNSIENVYRLGELMNLRDLQLTCHTVQSDNLKNKMKLLVSILRKLTNLKSLTLLPAGSSSYINTLDAGDATTMNISSDDFGSVSSPPVFLWRLELLPRVFIFSNLPKCVGNLVRLCVLKIGLRKLEADDVHVLGGLPSLTVLSLYLHANPAERLVFDKAGFLVLRCFKFWCSVPLLKFEVDSMPNLRKLKLGFHAQQGTITIPVGTEHLPGLKKISVKIEGTGAEESYARSVEFFLGEAIRMHPGHPNVDIQCVHRVFGATDYKSSRTQEEEHPVLVRRTIERATWKLAFRNPVQLLIFTEGNIKDTNGDPLQISIIDVETGSQVVLPQPLSIEVVPLSGDFPIDDRTDWTAEEFQAAMVNERSGKLPLLRGDVRLTMWNGCVTVNELEFTDNSLWSRCRKFRIGVRVVPGSFGSTRICEALSEAFVVRDRRGERYTKRYPPRLDDHVWRLAKIGKNGAFHRKLSDNKVKTVKQFLRMLAVYPEQLRMILGDRMTDSLWEATTKHAKTCFTGEKVYSYSGQHATIYVNSILEILKMKLGGTDYPFQQLNKEQKAYACQLQREAYNQRTSLQEVEVHNHDQAAKIVPPLLQANQEPKLNFFHVAASAMSANQEPHLSGWLMPGDSSDSTY